MLLRSKRKGKSSVKLARVLVGPNTGIYRAVGVFGCKISPGHSTCIEGAQKSGNKANQIAVFVRYARRQLSNPLGISSKAVVDN